MQRTHETEGCTFTCASWIILRERNTQCSNGTEIYSTPWIHKPHEFNDPLVLLILNKTTSCYTPDSTVCYEVCHNLYLSLFRTWNTTWQHIWVTWKHIRVIRKHIRVIRKNQLDSIWLVIARSRRVLQCPHSRAPPQLIQCVTKLRRCSQSPTAKWIAWIL